MNLLFIAYKIEKYKGSEDGTGYNVARILAKKTDLLTLVTRKNNIDKLIDDPDFKNVNLIAVDVPKALSFYKKGDRGIILYYYLWQLFVGYKTYRLQKAQKFDVIHQFNFHATWAPHFIFSKARIIWGPLTHHPDVPFTYWYEGKAAFLKELARRVIKKYFFTIDPFLKWSIARTDHIFLGHADYPGSYVSAKNKISLLPQARSSFPVVTAKERTDKFNLLYVGCFISLKGSEIALAAFQRLVEKLPPALAKNVSFTLIGEGALYSRLTVSKEKIVSSSQAQVEIVNWTDQNALAGYYNDASLFLFPSFEGQGLVVAEAMSFGCPVLCLGGTGPETVAGNAAIIVPADDNIIDSLALQLEKLMNEYFNDEARYQSRITASLTRAKEMTWEKKVDELMKAYHD